ncbi:large ribosomal subunit protein uL23m isoform X3 [Narcine bancroftii]
MTLVRPGKEQPEDTVQFRIPMEMTKPDVKNYLQGIYNVPVAAVRTRIQYCTNKKRNHKNQRVKRPDYKVAYVQLNLNLPTREIDGSAPISSSRVSILYFKMITSQPSTAALWILCAQTILTGINPMNLSMGEA